MSYLLLKSNTFEIFGKELFNVDFLELLFRFGFNVVVVMVIVRFLYYPITKRKDYLFTYILMSVIIFFLCYVLKGKNLDTGLALGLFAIFGIIRYRTRQIPIKEMTYLFIVIGVSVINALFNKKVSYTELLFTNLAVIGATWLLEKIWLTRHESRKTITYERIELIKPEKHPELIADLEERMGLKISRIEVGRVDFLRDTARIRIFYYEDQNRFSMDDEEDSDMENDDD